MDPYKHPLFDDPNLAWGPPVTESLVRSVESSLGLHLPAHYVSDLQVCNGGILRRTRCEGAGRIVRMRDMAGIGYPDGVELSASQSREWDYPTPCLVLSAEGPTAVLLDYRRSGPHGEPAVVFVDTDHEVDGRPLEWTLASDYATFRDRLAYVRDRTQVAVQGVAFHEEILEAAEALGAVGRIRPDYEGGFTRVLEGWHSRDDGPVLFRVLQAQRPNGSRRMAELGNDVLIVESNIVDIDRFLAAFATHIPGRHCRLV
ncbi:MAG: hypothetical protein CL927_14120 [Deltaproteobacteria bacterium]|nr:hypothetical protein [Deltaproteobacteria bacterium]